MIKQEDLERIKQANSIINRGSRRLGVRPLYITENEEAPRPKSKLSEIANKLKQTAISLPKPEIKKPKPKPSAKRINFDQEIKPTKSKGSMSLGSAVTTVLAMLIVFGVIFAANPVDIGKRIINNFRKEIVPIDQQNTSALLKPDSGLIITSGLFAKQYDASQRQKELKDRLGVPLKLVEIDNFYTIQIGPSYDNHEDALLVFDELSRYSVGNLSLRFQ